MAEDQIYSSNKQCFDEETKQLIKKQCFDEETKQLIQNFVWKCSEGEITEFDKVYNNEEYILTSLLVPRIQGMLEKVFTKYGSEMGEVANTIIHNRRTKYKAIFKKFSAGNFSVSSKNITLQNNDLHIHIDNSTNPEIIQELISKGVDPIPIAEKLTSAVEEFFTHEIRKCVLLSKHESHKEWSDEEYTPVSTLKNVMKVLIDNFSYKKSLEMVTIIRDIELEYLVLDFEGYEAYDLLRKIDNIKKVKTIKTNPADVSQNRTTSTFGGKKNSSIICKIASRNKKYEILSSRKLAKGKGDSLPIQEAAI